MLLPALADSPEPADLDSFRNRTLALFLTLLAKYPVAGYENVKGKTITPKKLLQFANDVANASGLNSKESYMLFKDKYTANGQADKAKLMSVKEKLSVTDKILLAPDFIAFVNAHNKFVRQNPTLIQASGYNNATGLENAVAGIVTFLIQNYGNQNAAGVISSEDSSDNTSTQKAKKEGKEGTSWLLPAIGVGCVALGLLVYSQVQKKPRTRKSSYKQNVGG
jgi:hypothetical protein